MKASIYRYQQDIVKSVIIIIPIKLKSNSLDPSIYYKIFLGNRTNSYIRRYGQQKNYPASFTTKLVTGYFITVQ